MYRLKAIHEVVYTAQSGERAVAAPGSTFDLGDPQQVKHLTSMGAVAVLAEPQIAKLVGVQDAPGETRALSEMTKAELLEIAQGMGIEGAAGMTKAALIEAIEAEDVVI